MKERTMTKQEFREQIYHRVEAIKHAHMPFVELLNYADFGDALMCDTAYFMEDYQAMLAMVKNLRDALLIKLEDKTDFGFKQEQVND